MKAFCRTATNIYLVVFLSFSWGQVWASTLNVPSAFPDLQSALNVAANSDTILVDSGTYSGPGWQSITFAAPMTVFIKSRYGAEHTIILVDDTAQFLKVGLSWQSPRPANFNVFRLCGFTISNARCGLRLCFGNDIEIFGCTFSSCDSAILDLTGGGAYVGVDSCIFTGNWMGMFIGANSSSLFWHNVLTGNTNAVQWEGPYRAIMWQNVMMYNECGLWISDDIINEEINNNVFAFNLIGVMWYPWGYWHEFNPLVLPKFNHNDVYGNTGLDYFRLPEQTGQNGNISLPMFWCDSTLVPFEVSSLSPLLAANNPSREDIGYITGIGCYCGDVDANGQGPDIGDLTRLIDFLFLTNTAIEPAEAGEIDSEAGVDVGDLTYLITFLFLLGPAPAC